MPEPKDKQALLWVYSSGTSLSPGTQSCLKPHRCGSSNAAVANLWTTTMNQTADPGQEHWALLTTFPWPSLFSSRILQLLENHETGKQQFSLLIQMTLFIHNKKYLCVFKSSPVIFHMSPEMDSESIPGAHSSSCTMQGKQSLYVFKSTWLEFIVVFLKFASSKLSLTHLFLQQKSKQAIRIIQLHHGSYFLFPRFSSMTGWQPVPNADFPKDNHKLPREGKKVSSWHIIFHLSSFVS